MIISVVNICGLQTNSKPPSLLETDETIFEAGFAVSDFSFNVIKLIAWFVAHPTLNPTFGFLIVHALNLILHGVYP